MAQPVKAQPLDQAPAGSGGWLRALRAGIYRQAQKRPYVFFIAPALIVLLAVAIYPILFSTGLSFFRVRFDSLERPFVGLENFITIIQDDDYLKAMGNTLLYVLVTVTGSFVLGFGTALLLRRITVGRNVLRLILIIPMMMAPIAVGLTWHWMLDPLFGLVNWVINGLLGLPRQTLLAQTSTARIVVMLVDIWQWYPLVFLILDAGLSGLPRAPYESARLEGAPPWMVFRRITLPMLRPVILVALLLRTVDAFRTFDVVRVMTDGGPAFTTETLSLFLYRTAFNFNKLSLAGAGATIMLVVIAIVSAIMFRYLYRDVEAR